MTDANRRWIDQRPELKSEAEASIPMGRWGKPRDRRSGRILASEAASYMTGSILVLDGGRTLW